MQVHSSATAAFLHCCLDDALTLESGIMLNSRSACAQKASRSLLTGEMESVRKLFWKNMYF